MKKVRIPAFLLFPSTTRSTYAKAVLNCRTRIYMTVDKPKPCNGTPAPMQRPVPPKQSDKATGIVFSVVIANEINTMSLHDRLLREPRRGLKVTQHTSILHVTNGSSDAFLFPYGCLVVWGGEEDCKFYETIAEEDVAGLRQTPFLSSTCWISGDLNNLRNNPIVIQAESKGLDPGLERLAISCALAQGIKLRAIETSIRDAVDNARRMSKHFAETGEVPMSRKEISKRLGALFLERCRYHLDSDVLERPEALQNNERYMVCYKRVARFLELRERGELLSKRIEALQEFYRMLSDEVMHHYSIGLELAITIMIAFEILLSLLVLAKQSMWSLFLALALFFCISLLMWGLWRINKRRNVAFPSK